MSTTKPAGARRPLSDIAVPISQAYVELAEATSQVGFRMVNYKSSKGRLNEADYLSKLERASCESKRTELMDKQTLLRFQHFGFWLQTALAMRRLSNALASYVRTERAVLKEHSQLHELGDPDIYNICRSATKVDWRERRRAWESVLNDQFFERGNRSLETIYAACLAGNLPVLKSSMFDVFANTRLTFVEMDGSSALTGGDCCAEFEPHHREMMNVSNVGDFLPREYGQFRRHMADAEARTDAGISAAATYLQRWTNCQYAIDRLVCLAQKLASLVQAHKLAGGVETIADLLERQVAMHNCAVASLLSAEIDQIVAKFRSDCRSTHDAAIPEARRWVAESWGDTRRWEGKQRLDFQDVRYLEDVLTDGQLGLTKRESAADFDC